MRVIGYAAIVLIPAVFFVPPSLAKNCTESWLNSTVAEWRSKTWEYAREKNITKDAQCISITICIQNGTSNEKNAYTQYGACGNTTFIFQISKSGNVTYGETTSAATTTTTTHKPRTAGDVAKELEDLSRRMGKGEIAPDNVTTFVAKFDIDRVQISKGGLRASIKVSNENGETLTAVVINNETPNVENWEPESTPINDPGTSAKTVEQVASPLISISIYDENGTKHSASEIKFSVNVSGEDTVKLSTKAKTEAANDSSVFRAFVAKTELSCVFYDANGTWSLFGCKDVPTDSTGDETTCSCNHTTVFAVMMSATVVTVPEGVQVLSYVVEVISIVFLLVTVFLLAKVRNRVRGDRVKVQICVAASLLCLHILNVFNNVALENDTACEVVTVLTHYFLLCSAFWMLMEGITLLFKTMDSVMRLLNGKNARKFAIARYVFSFTAPGIIVLISAAVGFSNPDVGYMARVDGNPEYIHCWVGDKILIGAVIIPVSISLLCCVLIVGRMFYIVYRMSSEGENFKPIDQRRATTSGEIAELWYIKAALKATLVLLPVLGVPWFLGFFTGIQNGEVRTAFMYVNALVNGLQGVMLFFVYCVIGKEVRKAIMKSYSRKIYALSSTFEFTSKQRRMTNDHSSSAHPTLSTNVGDHFSEADRHSNKSDEESPTQTNKL